MIKMKRISKVIILSYYFLLGFHLISYGQNLEDELKMKLPVADRNKIVKADEEFQKGVKSEEEANNFIKKNLFKFDDLLFNKLGSDINNLGITFSFRSDDYTIAVNIRSNSMQTIEMKDNAMVRNETVNQVLVDSDVFLEGTIDIDTVSNRFINDVIKINNNKIDNFIKNVSIY